MKQRLPKFVERHIKIVPSSDGTKTYIIIKNRVVILWFMYSFIADACIILLAIGTGFYFLRGLL